MTDHCAETWKSEKNCIIIAFMSDDQTLSSGSSDFARTRRVILQVILLVAATIAISWVVYALRALLVLLAFTIIFCYLVAPLVDFIERPFRIGARTWHVPHTLAIMIVYLLLFGGIALALERILPLFSEQISSLLENVPAYTRQLDQYSKWLTSLPNRYRLPANLRLTWENSINTLIPSLFSWVQLIVSKVLQLTKYLPWVVLIPIIGFFFLKDVRVISDKLLTAFSKADTRYRATMFLKDVSATLAAYIRAQLVACLLVGIIEGTGLWLLGVSYPAVFAVTAGLFEFVPIIGPLTLGIIATLVASFHSWHSALLIAGFLAVYRIIHDYVIYPRLLSQGMEIHPVAVILAVLSGAELGGVIGVFLSVPVLALLMVCWRHWREMQLNRLAVPTNVDELSMIESISRE